MRAQSTFPLLAPMAMAYPLALGVQVAIDTGLGDGMFLDELIHGRHRILAETLVADALWGYGTVAAVLAILLLARWAAGRLPLLAWPFRGLLTLLVASPALPGVPLMLGLTLAFSALGTGLWSWRQAGLMAVFALSLAGSQARADMTIIQVGGGDRIEDAQGQIEANVRWLARLLPKVSRDVTNYFAAGNTPEKDVTFWSLEPMPSDMVPLARVFDGIKENQLVYRHNALEHVDGPTTKEELTAALAHKLANVTPGGEVLLIYNGHGGLDWPHAKENYIRLWHREQMDVSEVGAILDHAPEDATVRFIFPQCFSGAFYNLIFDRPGSHALTRQTPR